MSSTFSDYLKAVVPERMANLSIPGAQLALVEGNKVTTLLSFGISDTNTGLPVTNDMLFSVQSISKAFAAWGVMTLVEEGLVELDAPIETYMKRWHLPESEFPVSEVTVRRLLSHRAGISSSGIKSVPLDCTDATLIDGLNAELPPLTEEQLNYFEKWDLLEVVPVVLESEPGQSWQYANGGYAMLELMIEDVSGQPFADYMHSKILAPLGLKDSTFQSPPSPRFVAPHGPESIRFQDYRKVCLAAGGLYATANDIALFMCAEMDGYHGRSNPVLSVESIREMLSSQGLADKIDDRQFHAGLGHFLLTQDDRFNVHHSGGSIGWRSIYSEFPETGDGFCMLINSDEGNDLWIELVQEWREHLVDGSP